MIMLIYMIIDGFNSDIFNKDCPINIINKRDYFENVIDHNRKSVELTRILGLYICVYII